MKTTRQNLSKSTAFAKEQCSDIQKAKTAIANGASVVECRGGYAIEFPTGGFFKITKAVHKSL